MDVLEQRGIITPGQLYQEVHEGLVAEGVPDTESNRQEYLECLVDSYFANSLTAAEIENYINLARKKVYDASAVNRGTSIKS